MRVVHGRRCRRRGVTLAECGVIYSATMLLVAGTIIAGLGVYRYEQVARLANAGARWASVHGPTWQQETGGSAPTSTDVLNVLTPMAIGLDPAHLSCVLTTASSTVSVRVSYTWVPEGFWSSVTLTNTGVMPISY